MPPSTSRFYGQSPELSPEDAPSGKVETQSRGLFAKIRHILGGKSVETSAKKPRPEKKLDPALDRIQRVGSESRMWMKMGGATLGEAAETGAVVVGEGIDVALRGTESTAEYLPKEGGRVAWIIGNTAEGVGRVFGGTLGGIGRLAIGLVKGVKGAFHKLY